MSTLIVAVASMVGFVVAYFTYGRWLGQKLFGLSSDTVMPSAALRDDVDYVPTRRSVVFGHHFTSIAGTGPIVGPALAVFWGWLPALLWVVFGSILVGGVHDFASLVISIRNRGETIGQVAGRLISPRARVLFLIVLAVALCVVLAVFGLVIATIFAIYPESVLSVWVAMPLAVAVGFWVYRRNGSLLLPSLVALAVLYGAVWLGAYHMPVDLADWLPADAGPYATPTVIWTVLLLAYAFIASVLPVWLLLQPRDYLNSHQLLVALVLLVAGLAVASVTGRAELVTSAPAIVPRAELPADAPPLMPFLFITIACGACSGFHCLVSSGTTSKQLKHEPDARAVGYGAMLLEGALAVLVILACSAGVGMGAIERTVTSTGTAEYAPATVLGGEAVTGAAAWRTYYQHDVAKGGGWAKQGLDKTVGAFVEGSANFLTSIGIPLKMGVAITAVLVACFAATTLDTATRLQRYVLQELGGALAVRPLENKYVATSVAVGAGMGIAIFAGGTPGKGGTLLWPLFGATNQLLAGLALMVATFYLARRSKPIAATAIPMLMMLTVPAWGMTYDLINRWIPDGNWLLVCLGTGTMLLQVWMVIEGLLMWRRIQGVLEVPPAEGQLEPAAG